jgi:hypothetical protein
MYAISLEIASPKWYWHVVANLLIIQKRNEESPMNAMTQPETPPITESSDRNKGDDECTRSEYNLAEREQRRQEDERLESLLLKSLEGETIHTTPEWWQEFRDEIIKRHSISRP